MWYWLLFCFNDSPTPEIYTLSLHDALPISPCSRSRPRSRNVWCSTRRSACARRRCSPDRRDPACRPGRRRTGRPRSEEHTSELQSQFHLVCRLLLEKKKNKNKIAFLILIST